MSTAPAIRTPAPPTPSAGHSLVRDPGYSREQVELVKRTIAKNATDDELKLFLHTCARTGLNPFDRQIYAIKQFDSSQGREVMRTQVSIDGMRIQAKRTGTYRGRVGPWWMGPESDWQWVEGVWPYDSPPFAARVGVITSEYDEPQFATARWKAYVQNKKNGDPTQFWARMGPEQLSLAAERLALRLAFPAETSGLFGEEEIGALGDISADEGPTRPLEQPVGFEAPTKDQWEQASELRKALVVKMGEDAGARWIVKTCHDQFSTGPGSLSTAQTGHLIELMQAEIRTPVPAAKPSQDPAQGPATGVDAQAPADDTGERAYQALLSAAAEYGLAEHEVMDAMLAGGAKVPGDLADSTLLGVVAQKLEEARVAKAAAAKAAAAKGAAT